MKTKKTCFNCKYFDVCGDVSRVENCAGYKRKCNGLLYDPDFENGGYNLPVFDNDTMLIGFSYRDFIDIYIANNGRENATAEKIKKELFNLINCRVDDCRDNFELCISGIINEIENN